MARAAEYFMMSFLGVLKLRKERENSSCQRRVDRYRYLAIGRRSNKGEGLLVKKEIISSAVKKNEARGSEETCKKG
jgi:hypothetical protein